MSEHPIVACHGGPDSADAVVLGAALAGALGEPLVIAGAYDYEPVARSARATPSPANDRRAAVAQAAVHEARAVLSPDLDVREIVVPAAGIATALVELACEVDASMLIVGRDTTGHVTRVVLSRTPCPVAVAPLRVPGTQPASLQRIGVAYDGSAQAHLALATASRLARATGARLIVLSAAPTRERADAPLHVARLLLDAHTATFETHSLTGAPAGALIHAAEGLDLLVCGSRGRRRALAAVLGSVSAQLVAHAHCPVLVVPPARAQPLAGSSRTTTDFDAGVPLSSATLSSGTSALVSG